MAQGGLRQWAWCGRAGLSDTGILYGGIYLVLVTVFFLPSTGRPRGVTFPFEYGVLCKFDQPILFGSRRLPHCTPSGVSLLACGDVHPNPGPTQQLRVITANVTSLRANFDAVVDLPGDIIAVQETRLGAAAQEYMASSLSSQGWQSFWGKPQPLIEGPRTPSVWNAAAGGVGVLVRVGYPAQLVPPVTTMQKALWDTGRWCHVEVAYGRGHRSLHVMSVYGFVGDGRLQSNQTNDAFLQEVFLTAAELGAVPVLLLGDLNIVAERSSTLSTAISLGRWVDLAAASATAQGSTPDATCFARLHGQGSRLDYALANEVAVQA